MSSATAESTATTPANFFSLLWAVSQVSAVCLLIIADVFQFFTPEFPLAPTVLCAVLLHISVPLLVLHIGKLRYPKFRYFQPFAGGATFVLIQLCGMFAWCISTSLLYWYFFIPQSGIAVVPPNEAGNRNAMLRLQYGVLTCSAVLSMTSGVLLFGGLPFFNASDASSSISQFFRVVSTSPNGETALVLLLSSGNLLLCVVAEYWPEAQHTIAVVFLILHFACGFIIHFVIGWKYTPRYQLFMPFQGGLKAALTSGFGWMLFAGEFYIGYALAQSPVGETPQYAFAAAGVVAFLATLLLAAYCHLANIESTASSATSFIRHGCPVLTLVCVGHSLIIVIYVLTRAEVIDPPSYIVSWVSVWEAPALAVLLLGPLLMHSAGILIHEGTYFFWQPFKGGAEFVVLQGIGWTLFASSILALVFRMGSASWFWSILLALLSLSAQLAIHVSIHVFRPSPPLIQEDSDSSFLQSELVVGAMLSFSSLLLCNVCDWMKGIPSFPEQQVMLFGGVAFAAASPLAYVSGRRYDVFIHPLAGCSEYIVLMAAGWTLYISNFFITAVSAIPGTHLELPGRGATWSNTLRGAFNQLPFTLIVAALYFQFLESSRTPKRDKAASPTSPRTTIANLVRKLSPSDVNELSKILDHADGQRVREIIGSIVKTVNEQEMGTKEEEAVSDASCQNLARMGNIVITGCSVSTFLFFITAGVLFCDESSRGVVLTFLLGAILIMSLACFGIHSELGPAVYPVSYKFWMPFIGGLSFVVMQAMAWLTYAIALAISLYLTLVVIYDWFVSPSEALGLGIVTGSLGTISQWAMLTSVWQFRPHSADSKPTFFEAHAEGILSVLICFGGLTISFASELLHIQSLAPIITSFVALGLAAPLAAFALRKSANSWALEAKSDKRGDIESEGYTTPPLLFAEHAAIVLLIAFPVLQIYVAYYLLYNYVPGFVTTLWSSKFVMATLQVLLLLTLASRTSETYFPRPFVYFRTLLITMCLYLWLLMTLIPVVWLGVQATPGSLMLMAEWFIIVVATPTMRKLMEFANLLVGVYVVYTHSRQLAAIPHLTLANSIGIFHSLAFEIGCLAVFVLYSKTFKNRPEDTGALFSRRFLRFLQRYLLHDFEKFFQFRVISDGGKLLSQPGTPTMIGFHPHGVICGTALYAFFTKSWIDAMGEGTNLTMHAASTVFSTPVFRDVALALGVRIVSKSAICSSIKEGNAVVLVPGGQAEMIESHISHTHVTLVTKHLGFIRIAIEQQIPLVPVFCFGEHNVCGNIPLKSIQTLCLRKMGSAFPVYPYGKFFLPFVPNRVPLMIVVGQRVEVPKWQKTAEEPTPPQPLVQEVALQYFLELYRVFEKHKAEAGYPRMELTFLPRLSTSLNVSPPRVRSVSRESVASSAAAQPGGAGFRLLRGARSAGVSEGMLLQAQYLQRRNPGYPLI